MIKSAYDDKPEQRCFIEAVELIDDKKVVVQLPRPERLNTQNKEPSLTSQNEVVNADINHIIRRHMDTGTLGELDYLEMQYGQITSTDLLDAKKMIAAAEKEFMKLPSELRKKFGQDAGAWVDFATNPDNYDQLVKWNMAHPKPKEPAPSPAPSPAPAE